jgi:hypothetical protein
VVPFPHKNDGIFWLRLYQGELKYIAVITEVPGNPSLSATNGAEHIADYVLSRFGIAAEDLVFFEVWPRGALPTIGPQIHRVQFHGSLKWDKLTMSDLEQYIGDKLPNLPDHEELYGEVLTLGGGNVQKVWRPIFDVVPVKELPFPHNPSGCKHIDRFAKYEDAVREEDLAGVDIQLEAGSRFLKSLTPREIRTCEYHKANWKLIAEESVRIVTTLGELDPEVYVDMADKASIPAKERTWLASLFYDPIHIGGGSFTNGQHRACALRFSGAPLATVVINEQLLREECTDWKYEGDG